MQSGRIGGGEVDGLGPTLGLLDDTAFRFQQDGRDGKAHGVVVDRENASWSGGRAGGHDGTILHTDCDGFTRAICAALTGYSQHVT